MGASHNLGFLLSKDYTTRKMNEKKLRMDSANYKANRKELERLKDNFEN